ncbi:MAG: LytTR family DNA-binding domain-containing protein [Parasphingorhabdus sp.]
MHAITQYYTDSAVKTRLVMSIGVAVFLNAAYCLIYRYTSGNPATLFEALSWGIVNIAPWVAVVELGRSLNRPAHLMLLFLGATFLSLCLEAAITLHVPTAFDLVRRIPGALVALAAIGTLKFVARRSQPKRSEPSKSFLVATCDWARSAGNYVEIHRQGSKPSLMRATLAHLTNQTKPKLIRIHRRYAVLPKAIDRIEHSHVRLKDGTRLPVGDRYREELSSIGLFAPSSQNR